VANEGRDAAEAAIGAAGGAIGAAGGAAGAMAGPAGAPAIGAAGGAMISLQPRREPIRRDADRRITAAGLAVSATFLALAIGSAFLPAPERRGAWLPIHLALPGAATVAIGAVLPFFIAALAAARPGRPVVRIAVLGLLASGALAVSGGVGLGSGPLATAGGLLFIAGLVGLGWLLVSILGGALGPQRGLLPRAYAAAIANVIVGASLATLYVAGWTPILEAWGGLKPAHAWLNVFGFVGLVISATLVHLYPTVLGTRISLRPSVRLALGGLGAGPATVALGYLVGSDPVARAGALVVLAGAAALLWFLGQAHRARGRWTTDAAWHRFSSWSLAAGAAWYAVGIALAAARVLAAGADPAGWAIDLVAAPLVIGFVLQVLVGSWTHLLPAVGPGDQPLHARQRTALAIAANARLAALNAGVGLLAIGLPTGLTPLVAAGGLAAAGALSAGVGLFARALLVGSGRGGRSLFGADRIGADRIAADRVGADRIGADPAPEPPREAGQVGR